MSDEPKQPKSYADVLNGVLHSRYLLATVLLAVMAIFSLVYLSAKPGTEISLLWGLARFQKDERAIESKAEAPPKDSVGTYVLPKRQDSTDWAAGNPFPRSILILDGTLNVTSNPQGELIQGANVHKLKIAGRDGNGNRLSIDRHPLTGALWVYHGQKGDYSTYIELEYRGNVFALEAVPSSQRLVWPSIRGGWGSEFTVTPLPKPTLDLVAYEGIKPNRRP